MRALRVDRELDVRQIGLDLPAPPVRLDLAKVFGNSHPVELEIGMGKGTFLVEESQSRPGVNFLGLEWAPSYWAYASDRLRRQGCHNVRTAAAEARTFMEDFLGDASLATIHVYFPDPWPKKKHHKRRLVQQPFLLEAQRVLVPGGSLLLVTDHPGYFEQMKTEVAASPLETIPFPGKKASGELVGTNFERKYLREGRLVHALAARKP